MAARSMLPTRRRHVLALVVGLAAAGCGDRAGDELARLGRLKDRMCACKDSTCTDQVLQELSSAARTTGTHPTKAQEQAAAQLARAMQACLARIGAGAGCSPDRAELVGELRRLKDQRCACKDRGCAERVDAALADWTLQHAHEMTKVKGGDDTRALLAELAACQVPPR